jgi:hypothetical protein
MWRRYRQEANVIAGMLKLNVNPMHRRWTDVQEEVGVVIVKVGNEVLEENLHIECMLSPVGNQGRRASDVASDTRWDKRGSTRRYDSLLGYAAAFGLRSNLPIGMEVMSSICIKCKKGVEHDESLCPKNYDGSAKGMEASGAAKIVRRIFENINDKCYVSRLVTDDDSLVRKILTHSYRDLLAANSISEDECPRYANGKKKPDNGLLPIEHPVIEFLDDKGHRVRGYARVIFAEACKSKKDGCGCTKMDAERMKRRLSWTLRLHSAGTYPQFTLAVSAVLEHHFNCHEHCGDWCQAGKGTEQEVRESRLRLRCKIRDKELYLFLKKHHDEFMVEAKLQQLFHQYHTNDVEGFNKYLTKFLPKDRTYCQTIENRARSMLAVCLQSMGHRKLYRRVFGLTGIVLDEGNITDLFFRSEDSEKLWRQLHRGKESVKTTRMRDLYKKLREGVAKLKGDNAKALGYQAGIIGPGGEDDGEQQQQQHHGKKVSAKRACNHCGRSSHSRRTSKLCPANPKNKEGSQDKAIGKCGTKSWDRKIRCTPKVS